MSLLKKFCDVVSDGLFNSSDHLLLAVSGGVDSVVLSELCHLSGFNFTIAHCNFMLRGKESVRDESFVKDMAKKYAADILVKIFETEKFAAANKISIQEAARKLRYAWFNEILDQSSATHNQQPATNKEPDSGLKTSNSKLQTPNLLLTAHHLDDNIETLLFNFFRGTGVAGLRGILPKQGRIVRPLLRFKKEELIKFAREHSLPWVEDSSNSRDKYSRNFIRHQLIPIIRSILPEAEKNLAGNLERFAEIEIIYRQGINLHKKKLLEIEENEVHIPVLKLKKSSPLSTILFEIIKEYGFTALQVPEVMSLLDSDSGKFVKSCTHRIIKNRKWLIIAPDKNTEARHILIEQGDRNVQFQDGQLVFQSSTVPNGKLPDSSSIAIVDESLVTFPLLLRKWKRGDYFYPLGMNKKKKLSRFFIDRKLSLTDKEKIWVLEMNKKILWVVGMRIDERFKITQKTKSVLQIILTQFRS